MVEAASCQKVDYLVSTSTIMGKTWGDPSSVSRAKYAMQVAMNLFVEIVDRTEGSGMKLTKGGAL
jgi:hypothetical protein